MDGISGWLPTLAFSGLLMFVLYRRARQLLSRQRLSVPRLVLRLALIGAVCVLLLVVSVARGLVPAVGLIVGAGVGLLGLTLTRFESIDGEIYYTPNTYLGLGVLTLFVGRLIYRMIRIITLGGAEAAGLEAGNDVQFSALGDLRNSALTLGVLFVLLGYYLSYYAAVLIRGRMQRHAATTV